MTTYNFRNGPERTEGAELELQIDGASVKTESVSLNGFMAANYELSAVLPGTHVLKGILTAGGLHSSKETSFVYGSSLPDLTTAVSSQQSTVSKDSTIQLTATAANQGKTPSNATSISLYDNNNLIETKPVNALSSGESQELTFSWNVFGKAGEHAIKAIIDPDNAVIEFNEGNNTSTMNVVVPDITLVTGTDKDTYKIRQNVNILCSIENLNSSKTFDSLTIVTAATDPLANEVYKNIAAVSNLQPLSINTNAVVWNTTGLSADGTYTISQQALSGTEVLAQSTKSITLRRTSDFNVTIDADYKKIRQGEKTTYKVYLDPLDGWATGITLGLLGVPEGTSVSFNPDNLVPPGESLTMVITTNATVPGIYDLKLTAEGTDEGETVKHELPLTLDVSGFGLSTAISNQTIRQLETVTFSILLDSINGYEGEVTLSLEELPYGIKATLDKMMVHVPGEVMLTALSSKYIKPGIYELTIIGNDGLVRQSLDFMITVDANPAISEGIITTPGPGPKNTASVSLISKDLTSLMKFTAFTTKYGAYAASADIDGDGYDEIVVAQGPGPQNSATLSVFKRDGTFIAEVTLFDTKYGMTLSSGDIDGDWKDEIIAGIGPGPGNPAELKVVKFNDGGFIELLTKTLPYNLQYGLNTALGDIDGDGIPEIITSPGPGPDNPATVTIWKQTGQYLTEMQSFSVFGGTYGVNISTGDIDGDGVDEIITGTGPDPKNQAIVRAYKADGTNLLEFIPYGVKHTYGVTVASADIDEDGIDEIITGLGPGPQNPSWVKVFKSDGTEIASFLAYPENSEYGVKVFSGSVGK